MITIYLITNKVNNKKYVGQTIKSIKTRWKRHCWACTLKSNRMTISNAILKYGKENFFIKEIDTAINLESANQKEIEWAKYYDCFSPNGYNLKAGGRKYLYMSDETKLKIGMKNKGRKASPETLIKLSNSHKGIIPSVETRLKLSIANKGRKPHINTNLAASRRNSKSYILINPDKEKVIITNMRQFCIKNNIPTNRMCELVKGKRKEYKGWTFIKYNE
jgi:group I intron endonuclease